MERVTLARALSWKRRRVFHRMSSSGEFVLVETIERKGRHFRLTLEGGHTFLVEWANVPCSAAGESPMVTVQGR